VILRDEPSITEADERAWQRTLELWRREESERLRSKGLPVPAWVEPKSRQGGGG
jgi:hypothetical protein